MIHTLSLPIFESSFHRCQNCIDFGYRLGKNALRNISIWDIFYNKFIQIHINCYSFT